jgi:hypothetical protein
MRKFYVKKKPVLFFFFFFLLQINDANGQNSEKLTGFVRDSDTGELLPGANIIIEGSQRGTSTDKDGFYRLNIEPGDYTLIATFIGYKPDTVSVSVSPGSENVQNFFLVSTQIEGDAVIVRSDRVQRRIRELAKIREERKKALKNYEANVHKLALVYEIEKNNVQSLPDSAEAIAFAERVIRQMFVAPKRYAEKVVARRSSDNFFSEYDILTTNGEPLNLNEEKVQLNILSEIITVIGPVSSDADRFYDLSDRPAGSDWPGGTTEIMVKPTSNKIPLFEGSVFVNDDADGIIGMDLVLNEAADVFAGLYSISNFKYFQRFEKTDDYWLPDRTEIEARVGILGLNKNWFYRDVWNYTGYKINSNSFSKDDIPLSGKIIAEDADQKNEEYWDDALNLATLKESEELQKAQSYSKERSVVNTGMAFLSAYLNAPNILRRSYITNISDFYRLNRVEGNYVGLGLRTPDIQENYFYKGSVGYATDPGAKDWRYYLEMMQFIPGTPLAIEGSYYRRLAIQFADYEYNNNPLNVDELRNTMIVGMTGRDIHNYFERQGYRAGLRLRFDRDFFFRAGYMREDHRFLPVVAPHSWFKSFDVGGSDERVDFNRNTNIGITPGDPEEVTGFNEGEFAGFEFHLHFDSRPFTRVGVFRDYDVRKFGWFTDQLAYWSDPSFGAGDDTFTYFKYRSSFGFRLPVFASQFFVTEIYVGGSDNPLPGQMQFGKNGFMVDDFTRRRPFVSLEFNESIGNKVSVARFDYLLGSSFVRMFPFKAIRQSGMQLRLHTALGFTDNQSGLSPVTPWSVNVREQVEVGFALSQIFGMFKIESAIRLAGDDGERIGFILIF